MKGLKKQRDQKLQVEKNSRMYHRKDGLSLNSMLSAVSGSFPPHSLSFFVIFLLMQTCTGNEDTSSNWPYLKVDARPKADPSSSLSSINNPYFYVTLTVVLVFTISLCAKRRKEPTVLHTHPTKEEERHLVSTLMEQKTETENLRDELLSQLKDVEREKEENKEKLQLVENELENVSVDKKQALLGKKQNLLEFKWNLDDKKTEKEKVLLQTQKLLQTIDTVTDKMSGRKTV